MEKLAEKNQEKLFLEKFKVKDTLYMGAPDDRKSSIFDYEYDDEDSNDEKKNETLNKKETLMNRDIMSPFADSTTNFLVKSDDVTEPGNVKVKYKKSMNPKM